MALKNISGKSLQQLIRAHLSTVEDSGTRKTIEELARARRRGYLTRAELITVCRWKSPRAINHIRRNRPAVVRRITRKSFAERREDMKLTLLMSLHGVSAPMASSILTLTHPARYGVMDIRVWQLLHAAGLVSTRANGTGLGVAHWLQFLHIIRMFGSRHKVRPRAIERTLFNIHEMYQEGTLYRYPLHRSQPQT